MISSAIRIALFRLPARPSPSSVIPQMYSRLPFLTNLVHIFAKALAVRAVGRKAFYPGLKDDLTGAFNDRPNIEKCAVLPFCRLDGIDSRRINMVDARRMANDRQPLTAKLVSEHLAFLFLKLCKFLPK